jgi:hypothetical protein
VLSVGKFDRLDNVRAVSAAAQGQQEVVLLCVVVQLLDEDLVEAVVIADGQNPRTVGRQIVHAEAGVRQVVPVHELAGEVLSHMGRHGRHAAVTDNKHLPVVLEGEQQVVGQFLHLGDVHALHRSGHPADVTGEVHGLAEHREIPDS